MKVCDDMREMKDSGIEWIGKIPTDWKISKIKYVAKMFGRIGFRGYTEQDLVDKDEGAIALSPSNFKDMKMNYSKCSYISWNKYYESPEIMIKNGDILLVKTGSTYGNSCIVCDLPKEATINPQLLVFKNLSIDKKFFFYSLQIDYFQALCELAVIGSTIPTMSQSKIGNFQIVLPPISEQNAIANYLDKKCAEIDKLTADIKTQIEVLESYKQSIITETVTKGLNPNVEMKDSGVEWLGKIPADWKCIKIKYLTKQRNEKAIFQPQIDKYIGLENVKSYSNEFIETESEYEESLQSICKKGDVLFNKLRPYLAKVLIVESDCFCTGEFLQFKVFEGDKKFLWYSLLNPSFIEVVNSSTYGAKMPRANSEFICNMKIPFPPLYEQNAIANFLDDKCVEIDKIIADKNKQLATIEEYKKSLIYEYVTGKKSV